MSQHPLIDLSNDREVKKAKGFRAAAAEMTGASLAEKYKQEVDRAPRRHSVDKKYLGVHPGKPPSAHKAGRDEEHLGLAGDLGRTRPAFRSQAGSNSTTARSDAPSSLYSQGGLRSSMRPM